MSDSLIDSLNKTNLDTEDQAPSGGPINAPQYNFKTKYSDKSPYETSGTQTSPLSASSLDVTALDIESPLAGVKQGGSGGPISTPNTIIDGVTYGGFSAKWGPTNKYFDPGEAFQDTALEKSLKVTALDVESNKAGIKQGGSGGPQRNQSYNSHNTVKPDGTYNIKNASSHPLSPTPGGPALQTKDNKNATYLLNQFTPKETYMQSMREFAAENMGKI
jgi:hypothetical protein